MSLNLKSVLTQGSDLYFLFSFLRRLVQPFNKTRAFELGIIDKNGKVLKPRKTLMTQDEKNAYTLMDTLIFNLKKLLGKVPGGKSRLASYAAALLLLREERQAKWLGEEWKIYDEKELEEELLELMEQLQVEWNLDDTSELLIEVKKEEDVEEDAPVNSMSAGNIAGSAEAGDDPPVNKKKKKNLERELLRRMGVKEHMRVFPSKVDNI